jgi:hypothetical protein
MNNPETLTYNPEAFDDSFFAQYETELADLNIEAQASLALSEILMIEKADGSQKSYEQLRDETRSFFANDLVRNDEMLMNRMAEEFAQACMSHGHGNELMSDSMLKSVYEQGFGSLKSNDNKSAESSHNHADDDYEIDPKTGKKTKKKKKRGWFGVEL